MRVAVSRTGGVAGIARTWSVQLDDRPEIADEVCRLVNDCPWDESPAEAAHAPGADRFVYRVDAGELTATVGEPQVQGPWRSLIDRVIDLGGGI
jgi:hypothetical protein